MARTPTTDKTRCYRPFIIGKRGAAAANHPLAAQAGLMVMRDGGNAVDAAVATAMALAVVEPMMSGLGGDGFYHVLDAKTRKSAAFNGTGPAPRAASPVRYGTGIPRTGPLSVSVPGTLAGLANMHRHYGSLPWARLCDKAVRLARDGFGATAHYRNFSAENVAVLEADERSAALFLRGGRAPRLGTLITQPHLARSLEEIAWGGAETLYRGALARSLAKALKECGALITEADLAEFEAEVQEPLGIGYHGLQILEAPPNSTGFVLLEELKILENFVIMQMGLGSADLVHVMVEPKSSPLPIARAGAATRGQRKLHSGSCSLRSYCARLAAQIDMSHAAPTGPGPTGPVSSRAGETTCFCTADDHGNAVSGIQSINSFWGRA